MKHAIWVNPTSTFARHNLAVFDGDHGQLSRAIELDCEVIKLNPAFCDAYVNLGRNYFATGQIAEAEKQLRLAVTLFPRTESAHFALAFMLKKEGRFNEAIDQYDAALSIDPNDIIARNNLAIALARSGRIEEAIAQIERVLMINPHFQPSLIVLKMLTDGTYKHGNPSTQNPHK
jgi:superkiller protein 3